MSEPGPTPTASSAQLRRRRPAVAGAVLCLLVCALWTVAAPGPALATGSPTDAGAGGAARPEPAGAPEPGPPVPEALPGAPPFPDALRERLARALAERGAEHRPRTRHLRPDGRPRYTNRLLLEPSPYLEQHAHNPVDWHPWGEAAFERARALDRPVFVSIGYSTCHWCHVMEEESFDDPAIARLVNERFIAVKVDRELRPDVDAVYMSAVQTMTGHGGWPLNVWLTPDREPFFGGTYFPPEDRPGQRGLATVLRTVSEAYRDRREQITAIAAELRQVVATDLSHPPPVASTLPTAAEWTRVARYYAAAIDPQWGGIGERTKFPATVPVRALLRYQRRSGDAVVRRQTLLTLDAMARGGIRDHVGGGFHRYATDPQWRVPHFEKMLYDNALLALDYGEAYGATGRGAYRSIAEETLDYLARAMRAPDGTFYSATDADSRAPDGDMREGHYFTWSEDEIATLLPPAEAKLVRAHYGVSSEGELDGRNVLYVAIPLAELAESWAEEPGVLRARRERALERLRRARARRPAPLRDEKRLAAWNGLAVSAFARAAFAFGRDDYGAIAEQAAGALLERLRSPEDGRLRRVALGDRVSGPAFLEDYAFVIAGLLDLYEARPDPRWLRAAIGLQGVLETDYRDPHGGYFATAKDGPRLIAREKPNRDGATPSGNSVAALNLLRLAALTADDAHAQAATALLSAFHDRMVEQPGALPQLWLAADFALDRAKEVALVDTAEGSGGLAPLLAVVRASHTPNRVLVVVREGAELAAHAQLVPWLRGKRALQGRATAYVCEDHVCALPTSDPDELATQLAQWEPIAPVEAGGSAGARLDAPRRPQAPEVAGSR